MRKETINIEKITKKTDSIEKLQIQSCFVGWEYSSIIEYLSSLLEILL